MKSFLIILVLFFNSLCNFQVQPSSVGVNSRNKRIVGGSEANELDWGWTVALYSDKTFFCGATLIRDKFLLTAAHCFPNKKILPKLKAFIGVHDRNKPEKRVQIRNGIKLVIHEKYDKSKLWNDIALIELDKSVKLTQFNSVFQDIEGFNPVGQDATISGWGKTSADGSGSPATKKQQVTIKIWNNNACSKLDNFNKEIMICGGPGIWLTKAGFCQGDSGGPLSYKNPIDKQWYVIGISSYSVNNCGDNAVFTKVSNYKKWIYDNIQKMSQNKN